MVCFILCFKLLKYLFFILKCHYSGVFYTAALDYLISHLEGNLDVAEFESACGIGVKVTPEDIEHAVQKQINLHRDELIEKRYILFLF